MGQTSCERWQWFLSVLVLGFWLHAECWKEIQFVLKSWGVRKFWLSAEAGDANGHPKDLMCPVEDGKDSLVPLMVLPALCFPPQQGSLSQQPGLLWFRLHWWCNCLKDDLASLLHLLKVLLKAADYSVNQVQIISFLSLYVTGTPKETIFLIQPRCTSSEPSWKFLQRIREDIYVCAYIPAFHLLSYLSASLFL